MKKILVIQNKYIGDVLIASVIAQNIKRVYPDCHVTYLVYDYCAGVIENHPHIDDILTTNESWLKKSFNLVSLVREIRHKSFDIIFDPYSKFQSRLICLFSKAPIRVGFKKRKFAISLPYYTNKISQVEKKIRACGKSIEDRLALVLNVVDLKIEHVDDKPKIYLTDEEQKYESNLFERPHVIIGILGSTPEKSLPKKYVVEIVNFLTFNYNFQIIFNYAPNQKALAQEIFEQCDNQEKISIDIYENSIRGFVKLMGKARLLIANEGGSVHIAKALNKPTFTIFSPYELKDHWASFDDGEFHASVHLFEEKPEIFPEMTRQNRRKIEANPEIYYNAFKPELVFPKLKVFLENHKNILNTSN